MIKFNVLNRFTGAVQFTAELDCKADESASVKLGLAVKLAKYAGANLVGANLARANLAGANLARAYLDGANLARANLARAYLAGAYLDGANLVGANLAGANLAGANLAGAYLDGAYLDGAYLDGANLDGAKLGAQWIVQGPARSDGYFFMLTNLKGEGVRVKAGCRNFTLAEARKHWKEARKGTPLGDETFAILDCLEKLAKAREYDLT